MVNMDNSRHALAARRLPLDDLVAVTGEVILRDRDTDPEQPVNTTGFGLPDEINERHVAMVDGRGNVVGLVDWSTGEVSAQFYYLPSGTLDDSAGIDPDWRHTYQQGWYDSDTTTVIDGFHHDAILTGRLRISAGEYWQTQSVINHDVSTEDPHASWVDVVPVIGSVRRGIVEDGISSAGYWISALGEAGLIFFSPAIAPVRQAVAQAAKEGAKVTIRQQVKIAAQHAVKGVVSDFAFDAAAAGVGATIGGVRGGAEGALQGAAWGVGFVNVGRFGAATGMAVMQRAARARQATVRTRVLANIEESQAARRASRFDAFVAHSNPTPITDPSRLLAAQTSLADRITTTYQRYYNEAWLSVVARFNRGELV